MRALSLALFVALGASASDLCGQSILYVRDGEAPGAQVDPNVCGAGDLNDDGYADFIVGSAYDDANGENSGRVDVYSGFDGSILFTWEGDSANDNLGFAVSGAGDVNGDGVPDVIVGGPADEENGLYSGSAHVFSGFDGALLYSWFGEYTDSNFGQSVSGAGDVNADGFDDVIVGSPRHSSSAPYSGSAYVFSGLDGSTLHFFAGVSESSRFGYSVSDAGDVDGDGFDDLLVGAPYENWGQNQRGRVRLFSGFDGSVLANRKGDGWEFGTSVSKAGDVDLDGVPDFIVGAPENETGGPNAGSAHVFSGADGSELYVWHGDREFGMPYDLWSLGSHVADAGDVNGDGVPDLIVGAPSSENNGFLAGSVRVYSGADGSELYALEGSSAYGYLGSGVAGAGDVNGDGFDDVIMGAGTTGSARVLAGGPTALTIGDPAPGLAGVPNTLTVTGAQPGASVVFLTKRNEGFTIVSCAGGGAPVYMNQAKTLASRVADGTGTATLTGHAPAALSNRTLRFQAIEFQTCRFSNLVIYRFP